MRKDLMIRLAQALEADAANPNGIKFDLNEWAVNTKSLDYGMPLRGTWKEGQLVPLDCGTMACAWGFAAISGIFKDEGLEYTISANGGLAPAFDGWSGFDAATRFFEIESYDAYQLFDGGAYMEREGANAELAVAQRLREFAGE